MAIKNWSTTAASNNSASPNGFPEGMAPSGVNDSARQIMADVRSWYEDSQWVNFGDVPTRTSSTTFTIPSSGTHTTVYHINRRLKLLDGSSTLYATISDQTFAGGVVTATVTTDTGNLTASLSTVYVGATTAVNTANPFFIPTGGIIQFASSTPPAGWLLCDGSAVSRTVYARLFAVLSTTWGAGDGSGTFNVPNYSGRVAVGAGTGTVTEAISATASSNAVAVTANNAKWITGMPVTVSSSSGFTGLSDGTHYIVRISSTSIKFASSLANAQNGTVETVTGTGTCTITGTLTARTLGEVGGEETHAMSITELLAHTHVADGTAGVAAFQANAGSNNRGPPTGSTGGNAAMNIMQPYAAAYFIIRT